jgi:hypothetical protein
LLGTLNDHSGEQHEGGGGGPLKAGSNHRRNEIAIKARMVMAAVQRFGDCGLASVGKAGGSTKREVHQKIVAMSNTRGAEELSGTGDTSDFDEGHLEEEGTIHEHI